jgi:hypothetical protein
MISRCSARPRVRLSVLTGLLLVLASPGIAAPPRVYVDDNATGLNDGSSWTNARRTLIDALRTAPAGAEVWVASGEYLARYAEEPLLGSLRIRSNISIYGGFAGTESRLEDRPSDPLAVPSVVRGAGANHVFIADRVFGSVLDGFIIKEGSGDSTPMDVLEGGGGLITNGASLTVRNCEFTANTSGYKLIDVSGPRPYLNGGGASIRNGSNVVFDRCVFRGNILKNGSGTARNVTSYPMSRGAAMAVEQSNVEIIDCTFINNRTGNGGGGTSIGAVSSVADFGGDGGAVLFDRAVATVVRSFFFQNATGRGGDTSFSSINGTAAFGARGGDGGAIYANESTLTLKQCTFTANSTGDGRVGGSRRTALTGGRGGIGGAIATQATQLTIDSCAFNANSTGSGGDGGSAGDYMIQAADGAPGGDGAAIALTSTQRLFTLRNSTFTGNRAGLGGQGGRKDPFDSLPPGSPGPSGDATLSLYAPSVAAPATIANSILWNDPATPQIATESGTPIVDHAIVAGGFPGTFVSATDPLFVNALGPDGVAGTSDDDLRLQPTSPAIDAGVNSAVVTPLDVAGNPRIVDGNGDGDAVVDLGAFEFFIPTCPCRADFDASGGTPDITDIDAFIAAWLFGEPVADVDCSGGTPDVQDIRAFFDLWLAGGC